MIRPTQLIICLSFSVCVNSVVSISIDTILAPVLACVFLSTQDIH